MNLKDSKILAVLSDQEQEILGGWTAIQKTDLVPTDAVSARDLAKHSAEFLHLLRAAVAATREFAPNGSPEWTPVKDHLAHISREHAVQGARPIETALFVLALKKPLFDALRQAHDDSGQLHQDLWRASYMLDQLGLYVTEVQQQMRDEIIQRQQAEMLELSTPVIQLWEGILVAPLIGTLDSHRAQLVTESLLHRVAQTGAEMAIMDITGVPTVDTMVAQHLIKTATALRLMGVECVISGIRPQISLTMVQLGVQLGDVVTRSTIGDAFRYALARLGLKLIRPSERTSTSSPQDQ